MDDGFDPYYQWLGIPSRDQPPNWYRLLGIERFETNANVIERAADRQMGHLRTFQTGKHAQDSQRLLNEVSAARIGLLSPDKRAAYDEQLRAEDEAAFPQFELPPVTSTTPPPVSGIDPPPPPPSTPPPPPSTPPPASTTTVAASSPIPAPLRTRRIVRRRKPIWKRPATWGVILLLLVLAALLGYAGMLISGAPLPSWLPSLPASAASG